MRIPEEYSIHIFLRKYTEDECAFISTVAKIDSPKKLLKYDQDCLAQELEYCWNFQAKNPFERNKLAINDFCKGIAYSWYIRTGEFHN